MYFTIAGDNYSQFYEDITENHNDAVSILKRAGGNYIIRMNALQTENEDIKIKCPEGTEFNKETNMCIGDMQETYICPSGYNYNSTTNKCGIKINKESFYTNPSLIFFEQDDTNHEFWATVSSNYKIQIAGTSKLYFVPYNNETHESGDVKGISFDGVSFSGNVSLYTYKDNNTYYKLNVWGSGNKINFQMCKNDECGDILGITLEVFCPSENYHLQAGKCSMTMCPEGAIEINSQQCYQTTTPLQSISACPIGTQLDPLHKKCYAQPYCTGMSVFSPVLGKCVPIEFSNKNGYYFVYLKKGGDTNINFLTPMINSTPIECKKQVVKCSLNGETYNSMNSCQKYCKSIIKTKKIYTDERVAVKNFQYRNRKCEITDNTLSCSEWSEWKQIPSDEYGICIDEEMGTCISRLRNKYGHLQAWYIPISKDGTSLNWDFPIGWFNFENTYYPITIGKSNSNNKYYISMAMKNDGNNFYSIYWDTDNDNEVEILENNIDEFVSKASWKLMSDKFCISKIGDSKTYGFECRLELKPITSLACPEGYKLDEKGCYKYEVSNTEEVVDGVCEDESINGKLSNLINNNFYTLKSCVTNCYTIEEKELNFINVRIRIGNDIATNAGDISILKITNENKSGIDYSDNILKENNLVLFGNNNEGIKIGKLSKNSSIRITYSSLYDNNENTYWLGIARYIKEYLNQVPNVAPVWINGNFGECLNVNAYYPKMGIYLDIDKDGDGIYDNTIKLSNTFLCKGSLPASLIENITFDGKNITYDYIDERGVKIQKTYSLKIKDNGVCKIDSETQDSQIPLVNTFLQDYIDSSIIETMDNAEVLSKLNPFKSKLGIAKEDLSEYMKILDNMDVEKLRELIYTKKVIPIPFNRGVYLSDNFEYYLSNTGIDSDSIDWKDYKIYAGWGYVPWNECKSYTGQDAEVRYDYVDKTDCQVYVNYYYSSSMKKCIGSPIISDGKYICPYGSLNKENQCIAEPVCAYGYQESPDGRCYKPVLSTTIATKTICKPWWRLQRVYECSNIDGSYNLLDNITAGPPRFIDICVQEENITK